MKFLLFFSFALLLSEPASAQLSQRQTCEQIRSTVANLLSQMNDKDYIRNNNTLLKANMWAQHYQDWNCDAKELKKVYDATPLMSRAEKR